MITSYFNAYVLYPVLESAQKRSIISRLRLIKRDVETPFRERLNRRKKDLSRILNLAGSTVPYYRDLFARIHFNPDKVEKDLSYLNDIPFLTKEIIREQGGRMLNETFPSEALHVRKTGASTGPSTLIYYSQKALDLTAAANILVLEWTGKKRHHTEVHLSSFFPEPQTPRDVRIERVKCMALNRVNILTDSFDSSAMKTVWGRLKEVKPFLIQGHPSTLYSLALYIKKSGDRKNNIIKVFESTGEMLDKKKRNTIENEIGCRVFDRYGNAEFGVVAHEPPEEKDGLKVVDFMVWPEVIKLDEGHEMVFTGLTNDAMPLIRYRSGDLGDLETRNDGFYLSNLTGRIHDIVYIGDKSYPTHYIQDLLDRIGGIEEFQVEMRNDAALLLRLVVPDAGMQGGIRERIRNWWGDNVEVEYTNLNDLSRVGWQGKFRYLVSGEKHTP